MTGVVDISEDLAGWATRAGYDVARGSQPALRGNVDGTGRAVIWANHGETRYFLGAMPAGGST
jgi:hypothetical protein